jgi:hypothetical protein
MQAVAAMRRVPRRLFVLMLLAATGLAPAHALAAGAVAPPSNPLAGEQVGGGALKAIEAVRRRREHKAAIEQAGKSNLPASERAAEETTKAAQQHTTSTATAPATPGAGTATAPSTTAPATAGSVQAQIEALARGVKTPAKAAGARQHSSRLSGAAIALLILGGVLALAALAWAIVSFAVIEPHWLLALRHSLSEAGFRATAVWAEFADWVRLGH